MGLINPYNGLSTAGGSLTNPLGLPDGAVGAPSLFFNNSPTTGIYRVAADTIGASIAGVQRLQIDASGLSSVGMLQAAVSNPIRWLGITKMISSTDGILLMTNNAATDFGRLQFGGTTSLFPSIKRDTIFPQLRLADDSAVCGATTVTLPAGAAGRDGNIGFDTTLNAFVYYVGGNRYKVVGVAF